MKIFCGQRADELFSEVKRKIKTEINSEDEEKLLILDEDQYVQYLEDKYKLDFPNLDFQSKRINKSEKEISTGQLPPSIYSSKGSVTKTVIIVYIPYSGDERLLKYTPNPLSMTGGKTIESNGEEIYFEIIALQHDSDKMRASIENEIKRMSVNYTYLRANFASFNGELRRLILEILRNRKEKISRTNRFLNDIGIPIKKRSNQSFTYPTPKRKKIKISKPIIDSPSFKPEPTMSDRDYNELLKLLNDMGVMFQQYPSIYSNKSEEDLRDYMLVPIQLVFEGVSATGETFNKKGKTDIILKYESSNLFVAECKIWKGKKLMFETVNQLMSYCTYRDTKTAVIFFVRNKSIENVFQEIEKNLINHPNFINLVGRPAEHWFNYLFYLDDESKREIKVAVMVFHFPE